MKFSLEKQFSWDINECIPHFYQVTMQCEAPPVDKEDCHKNGDCPTVTMVTIMACDLDDVCNQLKKKFVKPTIQKIVKFTKPALTRDDNGEDPTCNVEVTPTPANCVTCCDLLGTESESSSESSSSEDSLSPYIGDVSLIGPTRPRNFIRSIEGGPSPSPDAEHLHDPRMLGLAQADNFSYYGTGTIVFTGGADIDSNNDGEIVQNITFSEQITDELIKDIFIPTTVLPLPQTLQVIQIPCSDADFTLTLELKHKLDKIKPLAAFLKTNNLRLPGILKVGTNNVDFIKLNYNTRDDQWRGNLHYSGQSPSGSGTESWDIGITFACLKLFWQFGITINNGRKSSRLIAYYRKEDVCPGDAFFGFRFTIDTTLLESKPATSQPIVLNDEMGFFKDLQLAFRVLSQNRGSGSHQLPVDNTIPYDASFVTTGGV